MTTPVHIIGSYISPYVRKVLAALALKGIDYDIDPIVPFFGSDRFSAISPLLVIVTALALGASRPQPTLPKSSETTDNAMRPGALFGLRTRRRKRSTGRAVRSRSRTRSASRDHSAAASWNGSTSSSARRTRT